MVSLTELCYIVFHFLFLLCFFIIYIQLKILPRRYKDFGKCKTMAVLSEESSVVSWWWQDLQELRNLKEGFYCLVFLQSEHDMDENM